MDALKEDIKYCHNRWKSLMKTRSSPYQQIELETRMGVVPGSSGTKELYWTNGYKYSLSVATRKTKSQYINKILYLGKDIIYRQRDSVWQMKALKESYANYDLYMKTDISVESPSHGPSDIPNIGIDLDEDVTIRRIARHSFYVGNSARIDFSKVYTTSSKSKEVKLTFETEVEYVHTIDRSENRTVVLSSPEEYFETIIALHKSMFQTPIVFTYTSLTLASGEANAALATVYPNNVARPTRYVNRAYFSEARALDIRFITSKGMFANGGYRVGLKTDGDRLFLILSSQGCFGMYPPSRAILFSQSQYSCTSGLTIVDCEMYNGELWFIDALFIEGTDLRQINNYMGRRAEYDKWSARMTIDTIGVRLRYKESIVLSSEGFFSQIKDILDRRNEVDFESDGLMFTPIRLSYTDSTLDERAILKWKPEITIDFRVADDGKLYYVDDVAGTDMLFVGTEKVPFEGDVIMNNIVASGGSVVEFKHDKGNLVAIRNRTEKLGPNSWTVVRDNWEKSTVDQVTEEVLTGGNNALMRKYHGKIKSGLFYTGPGGNLLDIGSGRGADMSKWDRYDNVIAVEPSDVNIAMFRKRLEKRSPEFQAKIHILKARGQDTKVIRDFVNKVLGKNVMVDAVSMMNSLTFFFDSDASLDALSQTIGVCLKEDGLFLWKCMNGDSVKRGFTVATTDRLEFGVRKQDYLQKLENGQLEVHIEPYVSGSEWYTNIDELQRALGMKGDVFNASDEYLLPSQYKELSALYSYGVFRFTNTVAVPRAVERILFNGAKIGSDFKPINSDNEFSSCIEAVESMFVTCKHVTLLQKYTEEAYLESTSIVHSTSEPTYTKFETAGEGYFVRKFFERFPVTERQVIANSNAEDFNCSLAFADLLDLDVFVVDDEGNDMQTNSIVGSTRPYVVVVYSDAESVYYMRDTILHSSTTRDDATRIEVPDIAEVFTSSFPLKFKLTRYLELSTPVLLRCAYNTSLKEAFRIACLANYLYSIEGEIKISRTIVSGYGFTSSRKAIAKYISKIFEKFNEEYT